VPNAMSWGPPPDSGEKLERAQKLSDKAEWRNRF